MLSPRAEALRVGFARAWREPPLAATSGTLRFSGAFFFTFAGVLLMICAPIMPGGARDYRGMFLIGLLGVGSGALCYLAGDRLRRWFFEVLMAAAIICVTLVAHAAPHALGAFSLAACLTLPIAAAAMLLSVRQAVPLIALALVCRGWVVASFGGTAAAIVMLEGCTIGLVGMVAWLARAGDSAERDALTGLPNRRGLERRLEAELLLLEHSGGQCSLVALDLDYFKRINDAVGHAQGDRMITMCAAAWRSMLPEDVVLSRYGGDRFILMLPDTPLGRAADVADQLRATTGAEITVSAGVAAWQFGDSGSMLLNRADVALYDAKTAGRDRTVVYGDPGREASELEAAIANGEMRMLLQPIVNLPTGEPESFEALIRWERPGRGVVSPLDFVPHAERTGAIHSLGAWVLEECCRLAMTLPGPPRSIGVNVSVHELRRAEYASDVRRLLEAWQLPGEQLIFEVTESVFEDEDPQVTKNLRDLRALGALVAIDDFGAGYSSLRRIEHLPIDVIKVDGALVCTIREGHDTPILRAVVTMAQSLGVRLVAEHVENEYQANVLHSLGYDLAQGYYFGPPGAPGAAALVGAAR